MNDPEIIKKLDEIKWELSKTRIAIGWQLVWIGVALWMLVFVLVVLVFDWLD